MTEPARLIATPSQTVGPFFHVALTSDASGGVVRPLGDGAHIRLLITVTDGDRRAVTDAVVEVWQAGETPAAAFGRLSTGTDGSCEFETVRPGRGPEVMGAPQAPHINLCLFARGLLRQLYTRLYFEGDRALDADPVLSLVPRDRRGTLLATPDDTQPGRWRFPVRLQGPEETVFFDA